MEDKARDSVEKFVFVESNKLVMYKLSIILSQTTIQYLIRSFLESDTAEVCVLVVNMQETTKKIVNHVRIMIEEAETLCTKQMTKMFVMLLHFPPAQFYRPCYPSLFLKGWDHCYLDTIAHSAVVGVVDIRDWFWQCCFPTQSAELDDEDTLLKALKGILLQSIPVLSARVFFGSRHNGSFNCSMNGLARSKALKKLLKMSAGRKNGDDENTVGDILCEKFRAYWKPSVMAEQLEKVAIFSKNRESTLNITESIHTNFKSLFMDFLVYMVSRMNENYNIDILFDEDCSDAVRDMFLQLLAVFPTSKLSKVSLLSNSLLQPKPLVYAPRFPFFRIVCEIMEKVVEQSREEANVELDILSEITSPPKNSMDLAVRSVMTPQNILNTLHQAIKNRIADKMEVNYFIHLQVLQHYVCMHVYSVAYKYMYTCIKPCLYLFEHCLFVVVPQGSTSKHILELVGKAMSNNAELWDRYFNDFVLHKLRLDSEDSAGGIAQKILQTFMSQLQQLTALERLINLHAYLHVYQLDLAKMASVLRPLNKLHKVRLIALYKTRH